MAFKLTKEENDQRSELVAKLSEAWTVVEEAVSEFNDKMTQLQSPVSTAVEEYNKVLETVDNLAQTISERAQAEMEDKSEAWQNSDNGADAQSWVEEWGTEFDTLEVEFPEELAIDDPEHSTILDDLPESA